MKDNLPILEVKALGGFSMRYGEKTISIGSGKSTKAVKLLQILVCSEGRTVSRERLLDMLYGNEDITDAANNLRVTTFRLKKMLVTAGLPQYDYIQIKSGMYSFAAPMEVVLDAEGLCHCATRQMRQRMPKRRSIC
jgi:two-component SAPR family response regulator